MSLFPLFQPDEIENARKRVWNKMESKLHERELLEFGIVLNTLGEVREELVPSRLKQMQFKEHLMDRLPDRVPPVEKLSKRAFVAKIGWGNHEASRFTPYFRSLAGSTLMLFCAVLFVPIFTFQEVHAQELNELFVAEGSGFVNGEAVEGTLILREGDIVRTGAGSLVHLELMDDSRVTLGPDTQVQVVDLYAGDSFWGTQIELKVDQGRLWSQVPTPSLEDSSFVVNFPEGEVRATQKSTFDLNVRESTEIQVVQNLVSIELNSDQHYAGYLGQGAHLLVDESSFEVNEIVEDAEDEIWWEDNVTYGEQYTEKLEEEYLSDLEDQHSVLPGDWLYPVKSLGENVQVAFSSEEGREDVLADQAERRLEEAQVLMAQGEFERAELALESYQDLVAEDLVDSDNSALLAAIEETQSQFLFEPSANEGEQLISEYMNDSKEVLLSDLGAQNDFQVSLASQILQNVPELIARSDFEGSLLAVEAYEAEAKSVLNRLEALSLDQREGVVIDLLEQKLEDIQTLRVIQTMPELQNEALDEALYEQLSLLLMSLRERELGRLADFFENTSYEVEVQHEMYMRLKNSYSLSSEVEAQLLEIEEELEKMDAANTDLDARTFHVNLEVFAPEVELVDQRFEMGGPALEFETLTVDVEEEADSEEDLDQGQLEADAEKALLEEREGIDLNEVEGAELNAPWAN
jgi:hypothetical protein